LEVEELFDFCVQRSEGNLSVIKEVNTTDLETNSTNYVVDNTFLFGLGKYINMVVTLILSTNVDPWTNTGEPLGIQFYITYFVPIPFYSTCDRDINTMCKFGYGFDTGVIVLLILAVLGLVLWFIIPSTAGFLVTIISMVGYFLFAISIIMVLSLSLSI